MKFIVAIGSLIASCAMANAQKSDAEVKPAPCFEVTYPPKGGQSVGIFPGFSILLNRCTGQTWILVSTPKGADKDQSSSYRWYPLLTDTTEATLGR